MERSGTANSETQFQKEPERKPKSFLVRVLKSFCTIYLLLLVFMWLAQSWLMFPGILRPGEEIDTSHPQLKTVQFESGDSQLLQGLFYRPENPRGVIIVCHGNADLLCYMEEEVIRLGEYFDVAVLAFDFRGFGNSEGFPNSKRLYEDGQAAYEFALQQGFKQQEVVILGRSLGGAIAVSIASENPVAGLALKSTFSDITDVAAEKYFWLPVRWLISNHFPSDEKIASYEGPLVQVHGNADRIVPFKFGQKLFDSAAKASPKTFIEDEGRGHNQDASGEFWHEFRKMLDTVLKKESDWTFSIRRPR